MSKRSFLSIILSLVLLLSAFAFTACGGEKYENLGDNVFCNEENELWFGDYESVANKTQFKITFTPGYGDNWIKQVAKEFIKQDQYKDSYYIKLDMDSEATTSVVSKLSAGRNLSDLYMILASPWESYAALDQLENLDDLYNTKVPGENVTVLEKITGTWKTYGRMVNQGEEHYYVMPWNENITGIAYNADMFAKYNWEIPETVAELKALCDQILKDTNNKVRPFVYPGSIGGYFDFLGTTWWLQASGIDGLNEFMKFESAEVYNPAKQPGMGKLMALYAFDEIFVQNKTKYTVTGSAGKNHLEAQMSFGMQEAAMIPNGNWLENESGADIPFTMKMMRVPYVDNAKTDKNDEYIPVNYTGAADFMLVPKDAKQKQIAKDFLAFMAKDEILQLYTQLTGAPRPFDYEVTGNFSPFVQSCLDIWSSSTSWFESSTSPLWRINKAKKYPVVNPYTELMYDETQTPDSFYAQEYNAVKNSWQTWLDAIA